jgi:uncharacterized protein
VNYLKQFVIPFSGLKPGTHQYKFIVDDKFFEALDYSLYRHGTVNVGIDLIRQDRMLIFDFAISGFVEVACDRCLDPFNYDIDGNRRLIFKFGSDWEEVSDEIFIIPESEYQIDITHYLYEYISLMLPIKCIHPDDENGVSACNPEMLKYLDIRPKIQEIDPRWDGLKKLKKSV